jgi:predicted DNA-binding transcriptional regulator AlpA
MTDNLPAPVAPLLLDAKAAACQLLTVRDISALLKIHTGTIWRLSALAEAGHGDFPKPLRLGGKTVRWRLLDVQAYLDRLQAVPP